MSEVRLLDHWSPPDGAGDAVAALATTFTFSADFFAQDCLSRFLQLSTVSDEGDEFSVIAALLEEEDRLNDAQVTVLIDRSSPAEKRNLRWDVLPVGIGTGLLHAKVAILMWERATRVIIGSANLTEAGYRRQVEAAVALDLDADCGIPEGRRNRHLLGDPDLRRAGSRTCRRASGAGTRDSRSLRCRVSVRWIWATAGQDRFGSRFRLLARAGRRSIAWTRCGAVPVRSEPQSSRRSGTARSTDLRSPRSASSSSDARRAPGPSRRWLPRTDSPGDSRRPPHSPTTPMSSWCRSTRPTTRSARCTPRRSSSRATSGSQRSSVLPTPPAQASGWTHTGDMRS